MNFIDKELNRLLWRWGNSRTSEYLGYPKTSVPFRDYLPPGYRVEHEPEDIEPLSRIIDNKLDRLQTEALKCRYRYKNNLSPLNKRQSAKHMNTSIKQYMEYFDSSIRIIEVEILISN